VHWVGRLGRQVGVGTGASVGALTGAGFGLLVAFLGNLITWGLAGDVGAYIGLFVVLPVCVLGGALLGARSFLWFRLVANRLRLRHRRVGALVWVLGCALLALLAALALAFAAAILDGVLNL
jgi:hypothetical protein